MTHPEVVSFADFAKIARVKPSYVTALKTAGRLVLTEDGKRVQVAPSLQRIEDTKDPSKVGVAARHAAERDAVATPAPRPDIDPDEAQEAPEMAKDPGYQEHRRERERWNAAAAKRDYEISTGKLMDAAEVEAAVANAGVTLRKAMERLAPILAPQIAPISDEGEIRAILESEFELALEEMSRLFAVIAKEAGGHA